MLSDIPIDFSRDFYVFVATFSAAIFHWNALKTYFDFCIMITFKFWQQPLPLVILMQPCYLSPGEHTQYISVHLCREGVHQQSTQTTEDTTCYLPTQTVELADCKGIFSISLSKFDLEPFWPRKCETSQRSSHRVAFQSRTVL